MGYIGQQPAPKVITSSDLADDVVTSAKIADGTIASADLASGVGGRSDVISVNDIFAILVVYQTLPVKG